MPSNRFCIIREVKEPSVAHSLDAGIDFYVPEFSPNFMFDFMTLNKKYTDAIFLTVYETGETVMVIPPHSRVLIPSGVKFNVDSSTALIAFNKSGVASKMGLDVMAQVIDPGYQGEIHIGLNNTSNKTVYLRPGLKIIQFIRVYIDRAKIFKVAENELFDNSSERGSDGFGSTDTKKLDHDPNI